MSGLSIIFAGSGEFAVPTVRALAESRHHIVQVVTQPDRPAGRGRRLTGTPVAQFAEEAKLPLLRTGRIDGEQLPQADVMVVIAFGQKIAESQVKHPRLGSINLHASLLPKYRGAAPINWQIINGESLAGNSVIRLAARMDAGAILAQSELLIDALETAGELHDRLAEDGVALVMNVLGLLERGEAVEVLQDESRATLAPKLSREAARIDWSRPAEEVARRIRGMYPWPGCHVRLVDASGTEVGRVMLVRAKAVPGEGPRWGPGEIISAGAVSASDGKWAVEIVEVQPEGRRAMPLADYRNGHPWQPGLRLESLR